MGMTAVDIFTPLESLLLLQSLATHGTHADAFTTVSASLKESEILRDNADFNEEKLSEESLKAGYLRLLKDEAKQHLQTTDQHKNGAVDGESATAPERPLSPQFPTIDAAERFACLIPQLVIKLWDLYKNQTVEQIKEDERRYDELVADVKELEKQEQVEIVQRSVSATAGNTTTEPQDASSSAVPQDTKEYSGVEQDQAAIVTDDNATQELEIQDVPKPSPSPVVVEARPQHRPGSTDGRISSILNPPVSEPTIPGATRRTSDYTQSAPPLAPLPPQLAPTIPHRRNPPTLAPATTPRPHLAQSVLPLYHQSPYEAIQPRPNLGLSSIQQFQPQTAYTPVLPLPLGMQAPPSPWSPPQNTADIAQRIPSIPTASRQLPSPDQKRRQSLTYAEPSRPPAEQWQAAQPYVNRQAQQQPLSYHQQAAYQTQTPRGGGVMLPPFQVSPQNANASNQRTLPPPSTVAVPPKVQPRPPGTPAQAQSTGPARVPRSSVLPRTPVPPAPQTPMSVIHQLLRRRPGVTFSPGSSTGWKINTSALPIEEAERPLWSPVSEHEDILGASTTQIQNTAPPSKRSARGLKNNKTKEALGAGLATTDDSSTQKAGRSTRGLSKTPSISATTSRGRTRSQSVASLIDESLLASISSKRKIKNEPNTPAPQVDDFPAESKPQPIGRGRRKKENPPAAQASNKRKRIEIEPDAEDIDELTTPRSFHQNLAQTTSTEEQLPLQQQHNLSPTVIAFRNFQKMTAPIMNNITSHKHASIFANPVKERDAEGYADIIRRPQDLKTIRTAIVAGGRTVAALTASDGVTTPGTPRGAGSNTPSGGGMSSLGNSATTTLPWSVDLVPPRAIVNGAQLELEVMRMFANAVMFNAGDEGVVKDTREMFETVEASIAAWRAAERNAAEVRNAVGVAGGSIPGPKVEEEPDELGEGDESMAMPPAKRRRG